eukprot:3893182-Lingulodinium_polyedra.AAC.1
MHDKNFHLKATVTFTGCKGVDACATHATPESALHAHRLCQLQRTSYKTNFGMYHRPRAPAHSD